MLRRLLRAIKSDRRTRRIDGLIADGVAAQRRNDLAAATECYKNAIAIAPDHGDVLCLLGNALRLSGHSDDAIVVLRRAVNVAPDLREAHVLLADALPLPAHRDEVVRALNRALELGADSSILRLNYRLARIMREAGSHEAAIRHFELALESHGDTHELDIHAQLANLLHVRGYAEDARRHYDQAWEISRDDSLRLKRVTIFPPLPVSIEHIARIRAQLREDAEALLSEKLHLGRPEIDIGHTDFYLAYHGLDDRALKELLAKLYLHAYPALEYVSPHIEEVTSRRDGKLRIGVVSAYLREHTIGRLMLDFFRHLRRDTFHLIAFVAAVAEDPIAAEIHRLSDQVVILDIDLDNARRQVAAEKVDLLLYCDIGMQPFTYFMAFGRLAPVQCVTWGHPVTTGLPEMDYFISSALVEPEGAAVHYSERLECLPSTCTFACYGRPMSPPPGDVRARFAFPENANIYLCSQTLFKLHPDFDAIIASILRRDRAGFMVFISHPVHLQPQIEARWSPMLDDVKHRIRFLPFCEHDEFLALLRVADVVLDPPHFGGGNSSLEAIATGTPIVTMPGQFARSRFTSANYRRIGVMDCVASSVPEYIDLAVRLGTDRGHRERVKARLIEGSQHLYNDIGAVRAIEQFFIEAIGRARS